eukprot:3095751-Prymnesium_polylepis.1
MGAGAGGGRRCAVHAPRQRECGVRRAARATAQRVQGARIALNAERQLPLRFGRSLLNPLTSACAVPTWGDALPLPDVGLCGSVLVPRAARQRRAVFASCERAAS